MLEFITLVYMLEFGFQPAVVQPEYDIKNSFYTDLEAYVYLSDYFFLGGNVNTSFIKSDVSAYFSPFYTEYTFSLGLEIKNITIGYEHMCQHSVFNFSYNISTGGGYDSFFIRIESP